VGDKPLEEDELPPAPLVPFIFVVNPFPFVDEARKPDPVEKDDCGIL
jgi:hypothetical protein